MSDAESAIKDDAARWWGVMHGPDGDAQRAAFEAWRASDARHRDAYAQLERAWDVSAALGGTEMGRNRSLPLRTPANWATAPWLALAASLAMVVLLSLLWLYRSPSGSSVNIMASVERSKIGEIRTVKLADGSSVTLDTDSQIRVSFDGERRKVALLRGRARFEVRDDPSRIFIVEADGRLLSAASGRFDVQLAPEGLCLQSLGGILEIRPLGASLAGEPGLRLAPGQSLMLDRRGGSAAPVESGKGSERWAEGRLVFQGVPLSRVLAETNRYSATRIALADPALGSRRVTGTFRPLPVDELANALAAAFGLNVRRLGDGSLVLEER